MTYSARNTGPFDEHTLGKMREWLLDHPCVGCNPLLAANDFCKDCKDAVAASDHDQLLESVALDYPGGVTGFLNDLEIGNGELP